MRDHEDVIRLVDLTSLRASYDAGLFEPMSRHVSFTDALGFAASGMSIELYWERLAEDLDQDISEEYLIQLDSSYDLFYSTLYNQYLSFIPDDQELGHEWTIDYSSGLAKTIVRYSPG